MIDSIQFITNPIKGELISSQVEDCCASGIKWIQLRLKNTDKKLFLETALQVKTICDSYGVVLIINDQVDVAKEINASGVHLGKSDMSPLDARKLLGNKVIIGATANTFEDVLRLSKQGVDYIGLGPFRFTETKKIISATLGIDGYQKIIEKIKDHAIKTPIIAIGGIEIPDLKALKLTGIDGVAFSGLLAHSTNRSEIVKRIQEVF